MLKEDSAVRVFQGIFRAAIKSKTCEQVILNISTEESGNEMNHKAWCKKYFHTLLLEEDNEASMKKDFIYVGLNQQVIDGQLRISLSILYQA